jgi:haloalkane dehalogenase
MRPPWVDDSLFPFESRFVELGDHVVHYVDEGSGPVLLMLNGNPTWAR